VSVTLGVSNDASVSRGVLTTDGQTAVRDVLADNSPTLPDAYAYGSDGTAVSESDTALGNEAVEVSLDDVLFRTLDTDANWSSGTTQSFDSTPLTSVNGTLQTQQIAWTREGESADRSSTGTSDSPDDSTEFSNGDYLPLTVFDDFGEWDFEVPYTIPADEFGLNVRFAGSPSAEGTASTDYAVTGPNGQTITSGRLVGDGATVNSPTWLLDEPVGSTPELTPGTYTLKLDCVTGDPALDDQTTFIDVVAPYHEGFESNLTFDDTVNSSSGYLSGPELYPEQLDVELTTTGTRRNITEVRIDSTWNDTTNQQYLEARIGNNSFTRATNTQTLNITGGPDTNFDVRFGMSRFGQTGATPLNGANPQTVSIMELFANPDAVVSNNIGEALTRGVVPPGTIDGETLREAGLKNAAGNTLLSRHELAEFTVESGQRIASAETTQFTGDN